MSKNPIRIEIKLYMLDIEGDFTKYDIMNTFNASSSVVFNAISELESAGKIHYVQNQYNGATQTTKVYNTEYRPFSYRTKGNPVTNRHCIIEYILWLESDFTSFDIVHTLGISNSEFYTIKQELIAKGLIFNVCLIEINKRPTRGYNTVFREYDPGVLKIKGKLPAIGVKPKKSRKRVHCEPKDPLAGFVRPVEAR